MGIIIDMEGATEDMGWRYEWDCWVTVSVTTVTGRPLIPLPTVIRRLATRPVMDTRPLLWYPLHRPPYISSNNGGVKRAGLIIFGLLTQDVNPIMR
jgi:hypothetical protein